MLAPTVDSTENETSTVRRGIDPEGVGQRSVEEGHLLQVVAPQQDEDNDIDLAREEQSPEGGDERDKAQQQSSTEGNDDDDDDDVTVIVLENNADDAAQRLTIAWAGEAGPQVEARRRAIMLRELQRVQRTSFMHFLILCLIPTVLLFIVIATVISEDEDCFSDATICHKEPRSFINAFTTRCVCEAIAVPRSK